MEKINLEDIQGQVVEVNQDGHAISCCDYTLESIKMVAEKLNEVIEHINQEDKK